MFNFQTSILGYIFTGSGFIKLDPGVYAWFSLGGAVVIAAVYYFFYRYGKTLFWNSRLPKRSVFLVVFVFYLVVTTWVTVLYPPVADEPHYLVMSHSLVYDHDLDTAKVYANKEYLKFYPADNLDPHHHEAGLSFLVAPFYWLGGRFGVQVLLNFLMALVAVNIFLLCVESGFTQEVSFSVAFLMAIGSPLVTHASLVLTEVPAALLTIYLFRKIIFNSIIPVGLLVGETILILLFPWLHLKYTLLAVLFIFFLLMHLKNQYKLLVLFIILLLAGGGGFALFHYLYYGWSVPLHGQETTQGALPMFTGDLLRGGLGLLWDRDFGLFPYCPLFLFMFCGWFLFRKDNPKVSQAINVFFFALFLVYSLTVPECWSGSAAPSRMLVPVLPLLAPFLARVREEKSLQNLWQKVTILAVFIGYLLNVFPFLRYFTGKEKLLGHLATSLGIDPLFFLPALFQDKADSQFLAAFYLIVLFLISYFYSKAKTLFKFQWRVGR